MGRRVVRSRLAFPTIQPRRIKMMKLDRTDAPATDEYATVYVAIELSKAKWKLGFCCLGGGS